ncbi:MAG: FKBP-type peptidyl-prolyl cis-trans isomerase [Anaerolineaceae bacterium]
MLENEITTVQDNAVVQIAYNLTVDGEEVESNTLEYLHGHGNIISGLETPMTGMQLGESREVIAKAQDAYGEFDPEQVIQVNRTAFPADFEIKLNETMRLRDSSGHLFEAVASAIGEDFVELNMNHPMAGKDLFFNVTILSIRPATEDEIAAGRLDGGCASCHETTCGDGGCCD